MTRDKMVKEIEWKKRFEELWENNFDEIIDPNKDEFDKEDFQNWYLQGRQDEEKYLLSENERLEKDSHWKQDWQKLNKHMEEKLNLLIDKEKEIKELEEGIEGVFSPHCDCNMCSTLKKLIKKEKP